MLPKHLRLKATEIANLARRGKRVGNNLIDIRAWYDDQLLWPQFAISISTHVSKSAVTRNLIKRRLRVSIQELAKAGLLKRGKYLIIVKSATLKEPHSNTNGLLLSTIGSPPTPTA